MEKFKKDFLSECEEEFLKLSLTECQKDTIEIFLKEFLEKCLGIFLGEYLEDALEKFHKESLEELLEEALEEILPEEVCGRFSKKMLKGFSGGIDFLTKKTLKATLKKSVGDFFQEFPYFGFVDKFLEDNLEIFLNHSVEDAVEQLSK